MSSHEDDDPRDEDANPEQNYGPGRILDVSDCNRYMFEFGGPGFYEAAQATFAYEIWRDAAPIGPEEHVFGEIMEFHRVSPCGRFCGNATTLSNKQLENWFKQLEKVHVQLGPCTKCDILGQHNGVRYDYKTCRHYPVEGDNPRDGEPFSNRGAFNIPPGHGIWMHKSVDLMFGNCPSCYEAGSVGFRCRNCTPESRNENGVPRYTLLCYEVDDGRDKALNPITVAKMHGMSAWMIEPLDLGYDQLADRFPCRTLYWKEGLRMKFNYLQNRNPRWVEQHGVNLPRFVRYCNTKPGMEWLKNNLGLLHPSYYPDDPSDAVQLGSEVTGILSWKEFFEQQTPQSTAVLPGRSGWGGGSAAPSGRSSWGTPGKSGSSAPGGWGSKKSVEGS